MTSRMSDSSSTTMIFDLARKAGALFQATSKVLKTEGHTPFDALNLKVEVEELSTRAVIEPHFFVFQTQVSSPVIAGDPLY